MPVTIRTVHYLKELILSYMLTSGFMPPPAQDFATQRLFDASQSNTSRCNAHNPAPHKQHFATQCPQSDALYGNPYTPIPTIRRFKHNTLDYNAHSPMPHKEIPHKQYLTMPCQESDALQGDPYDAMPTIRRLKRNTLQHNAQSPMPQKAILTMRWL